MENIFEEDEKVKAVSEVTWIPTGELQIYFVIYAKYCHLNKSFCLFYLPNLKFLDFLSKKTELIEVLTTNNSLTDIELLNFFTNILLENQSISEILHDLENKINFQFVLDVDANTKYIFYELTEGDIAEKKNIVEIVENTQNVREKLCDDLYCLDQIFHGNFSDDIYNFFKENSFLHKTCNDYYPKYISGVKKNEKIMPRFKGWFGSYFLFWRQKDEVVAAGGASGASGAEAIEGETKNDKSDQNVHLVWDENVVGNLESGENLENAIEIINYFVFLPEEDEDTYVIDNYEFDERPPTVRERLKIFNSKAIIFQTGNKKYYIIKSPFAFTC